MSVWDDALADLHASDMATAAVYTPAGGDPIEIRVVLSVPSREFSLNEGRLMLGTHELQVRRIDVAQPAIGDAVTINGEDLRINSEPMLDVEGVSWTCWAEVAE